MSELNTEIQFAPPILLSRAPELAAVNRYGIVDVTEDTVTWLVRSAYTLMRFLGDMDVNQITPRDVAAWQRSEIARGLSVVSVNTELRGMKTMWSRLQRNGLVGFNPAAPVKYLPEPKRGPKAVSEATYRAMRRVADVRNGAILDVFWGTGCRMGGLISMDLDKFDTWQNSGKLGYALLVTEKGKKQRYVYLKGEQAEGLSRWLAERPSVSCKALFLTKQGNRCTRPGLSAVMRKLRLAAKIPKGTAANAHAFRHAFAIRMLDMGYDLATVSQWLGHHSPEFTASVYCVRSEEQLRRKYFDDP